MKIHLTSYAFIEHDDSEFVNYLHQFLLRLIKNDLSTEEVKTIFLLVENMYTYFFNVLIHFYSNALTNFHNYEYLSRIIHTHGSISNCHMIKFDTPHCNVYSINNKRSNVDIVCKLHEHHYIHKLAQILSICKSERRIDLQMARMFILYLIMVDILKFEHQIPHKDWYFLKVLILDILSYKGIFHIPSKHNINSQIIKITKATSNDKYIFDMLYSFYGNVQSTSNKP